jgi:chromosome partition protein MukF
MKYLKTLNEILTGFLASDFEIDLPKSELALLLLIYYRLYAIETQEQDISESELANYFQSIDRLESKDPTGTQARARAAISRLQKSNIIVRSDCGGLSALEPIFSLTSLGRAIGEVITRNLQFDKETLKAIISEAIVRMSEIANKSRHANSADEWRNLVTIPVRDFVEGAFERILRYQSSLDLQHKAVREEIFNLVQSRADQAIDPCVKLLDQSMQTIVELRDTLLGSLNKTEEIALDILVRARDAEAIDVMSAINGILKRTNQISEWTHARLEAWSLHYQNVQSFLRDVVRVDPNRQGAERLKNFIRAFDEKTPCLTVCGEPALQHLNTSFLVAPAERPTRHREDFAIGELEAEAGLAARIASDITGRIKTVLETRKSVHLSELLTTLESAPWQELHLATGIALQSLLSDHKIAAIHDYTWTKVRGTAEIQDIEIQK